MRRTRSFLAGGGDAEATPCAAQPAKLAANPGKLNDPICFICEGLEVSLLCTGDCRRAFHPDCYQNWVPTRTRTHTHTHTHTTCSYACMQVHTCRQAKWRKGGTAPSSMRLPCLIAFTPHTGTPYHKCCNRQPTTRMSTPCPSAGGNRLRLAYTYGTAGAGSARGCLQQLEPFGSPFRHDVEL